MRTLDDQSGMNLGNKLMEVEHAKLKRYGESAYKSHCPACDNGILFMRRDEETAELMEMDSCMLCAQVFRYTDIELLRQREKEE